MASLAASLDRRKNTMHSVSPPNHTEKPPTAYDATNISQFESHTTKHYAKKSIDVWNENDVFNTSGDGRVMSRHDTRKNVFGMKLL